jgi:hypothetical protein
MHTISTNYILGATAGPVIDARLREEFQVPPGTEVSLSVFEVRVDHTVRYCCWAGGELTPYGGPDGGQPRLTLVGQAAVDALANLPFLAERSGLTLVFQELKLGKTPLRDKVLAAFRRTADSPTLIAFVGDLSGELDGPIGQAFNISGAVLVGECAGMALPGAR